MATDEPTPRAAFEQERDHRIGQIRAVRTARVPRAAPSPGGAHGAQGLEDMAQGLADLNARLAVLARDGSEIDQFALRWLELHRTIALGASASIAAAKRQ